MAALSAVLLRAQPRPSLTCLALPSIWTSLALRAWRKATLPRHPTLADTQLGPLRDHGTETQHAVVAATGDQSMGDLTRFVLEKAAGDCRVESRHLAHRDVPDAWCLSK